MFFISQKIDYSYIIFICVLPYRQPVSYTHLDVYKRQGHHCAVYANLTSKTNVGSHPHSMDCKQNLQVELIEWV